MDIDSPCSNFLHQIHFSGNDSKFQESPLLWSDRQLWVVIVAHAPECRRDTDERIPTTAIWPWLQITEWHGPGRPLTGGHHTRRWPLTRRTPATAETKQLEDTHFPCGWAIHGRREEGVRWFCCSRSLSFQFIVGKNHGSSHCAVVLCTSGMSTSSMLLLRSDPLIQGGWWVHLAVVNSRRRNLITPFTITSQPPRGLDTRLGNCCRRKCSLKLTLSGTGTETRETTKAFRPMQGHSTYAVPLWGWNLVAERVHTHKQSMYLWLKK